MDEDLNITPLVLPVHFSKLEVVKMINYLTTKDWWLTWNLDDYVNLFREFNYGDEPVIEGWILSVLRYIQNYKPNIMNESTFLQVTGVNYYPSGSYYCPPHDHDDSIQILIVLYLESSPYLRPLCISNKNYYLASGDVIVFGKQIHEVPLVAVASPRVAITGFVIEGVNKVDGKY